MAETKLSIVIPAHNEAGYIEATLDSIVRALNGCEFQFEIIVVNDDSTDRTGEIAAKMGATVVNVALRNIGAVRNAGAAAAQGQWLIFVDADTWVSPELFHATFAALRSGTLGGGAYVSLQPGPPIPWQKRWIFPLLATVWLRIGGWAAGCYMFCTAPAFAEFGGFPEEYFCAEEFFFSRAIKRQGRFVVLPEAVMTSPRKLHDFTIWQLSQLMLNPILHPFTAFRSRKGLDVLYQHKR